MNKKLTLSIEQKTIEKAKKYAKSQGFSLSELVSIYFKTITDRGEKNEVLNKGKVVESLRGSFSSKSTEESKKALSEELAKKYI